MGQNVTIKDVAKEAGVSIATVSYVINDRTDMRISESTRKKVLQVINLLNYTPNQSAKALATNRSHMIALTLTPNISVLKNAEQLHFIHFLSEFLYQNHYDLIYINESYTEKFDQADAIVCYDISSDYFRRLADCNFVPMVAFDCFINDPLFFQVNTNYQKIKREAELFFKGEPFKLVTLETKNQEKISTISLTFHDICFIHDYSDIQKLQNQNLIVLDTTLQDLLKYNNHVFYSPAISFKKAEALLQSIEYALQRTPIKQHNILL